MAISDSKQRMSLVIEKNDKAILEDIAKENDRSVNYVINQAIKDFIKKNAPNTTMLKESNNQLRTIQIIRQEEPRREPIEYQLIPQEEKE